MLLVRTALTNYTTMIAEKQKNSQIGIINFSFIIIVEIL